MKTILKFLIAILLMCNCFKLVYALDEGYYSTISLSINSIGKEGLEYDEDQIVGDFTENVVREKTMDFLTNDGYRRRTYNHYERVSLPPYSKVDVGYYWYNNTPETVDVETIRVPFSRQIQSRGDVSKLLYDVGFEEGVTCTEDICRGGKYLDIEGVGLVSSDMQQSAKEGIVIATVTIKPAIEITHYEIEYMSEDMSQLTLYIQNNTDEYLTDILIKYKGEISKRLNFDPYEERVLTLYKYCPLIDNQINCGSMKITDNNTKAQCMVYGSPWDGYVNPDSISVFNKIDDQWIVGAKTQPSLESFCIQRLPYKYTTEELVIDFKPEEPEMTQDEYWRDLLDIDVLPITSYKFGKLNKYLTLLKPLRVDNLKVI